MTALNKQALTDEAISHAFTGTNFGRDDLRNILAETVIDAAAGWRCGYTATTICTQLGLLTPKGSASALGLRFISEHVQRETKRLKDGLEAAENNLIDSECHVAELEESLRDKQALLEAAEKRIAEQREYYEGVIADGSRRMAELEAKIETADKLQDSAFRHGLQHGFSYGQTNDQAGYEQCLKSYSSRGKDNG
ncbi:hypothetical protein ACFET7_000831 [Salmonella enterica subsp. enterica serovar Newport]